ncbi:uncharacterized conserved protein [Anaerolinea thermolimosa]|uniref:nickel-dependent lactate racemase n=1 Tax=Anaerolinea thermolimosa TaxID=229919 RepID=UPI0007807106|nr:nickel-dependent lactate racemase [Anaerolinea thermolimosa]GAP06381.1 uncharacterized conserved protein [Anaerolinea thermolimosa]
MALYSLPFGKSFQQLDISEDYPQKWIAPPALEPASDPLELVKQALQAPLSLSPEKNNFWASVFQNQKVAIAINDKTRPVPNHLLLPPLLEQLRSIGIPRQQISIWVATGSHLPMTTEEFFSILPLSIVEQYPVFSHNIEDKENLIYLGTTSRGTPVWVNRQFYQADLKIVVGDIEPHHFAGFSGGYKTAAIGLAGWPTINANHALLTHPDAWIGKFEKNPLRQDIEEIGSRIGVHLAVNAILNHDKKIVRVFAGHPEAIIREGITASRALWGVDCPELFDLVIASAGGYPKDINFYQAQKAITHASMFCKPGGTIVLLAECSEGIGSTAYEQFMEGKQSIHEIYSHFQTLGFQVGPHKAYQVARLLEKFNIILVSNIDEKRVQRLLLQSAPNIQIAFQNVLKSYPFSPKIGILPHATTTLVFHQSTDCSPSGPE